MGPDSRSAMFYCWREDAKANTYVDDLELVPEAAATPHN